MLEIEPRAKMALPDYNRPMPAFDRPAAEPDVLPPGHVHGNWATNPAPGVFIRIHGRTMLLVLAAVISTLFLAMALLSILVVWIPAVAVFATMAVISSGNGRGISRHSNMTNRGAS
jgi:hypothetical protein